MKSPLCTFVTNILLRNTWIPFYKVVPRVTLLLENSYNCKSQEDGRANNYVFFSILPLYKQHTMFTNITYTHSIMT